MPYEWRGKSREELHLWQHRSLTPRGFVWFMGITAASALFPLGALIGSRALLVVLGFFVAIIGALWWAIERNYHMSNRREILTLSPDSARLIHYRPGQAPQEWQANPFWVTPILHRGHKIRHYLTLRGGPREVELGVFLTAEERQELHAELTARLTQLRRAPPSEIKPAAP